MEESICHEMVIDLLKRFSCMKCVFLHFFVSFKYGPRREKTFTRFANSKGADQPADPGRLISAFVIGILESIISQLATSKFTIF